MLLDKDHALLISKPNHLLKNNDSRVMIEDASDAILTFYENNMTKINGQVVIVRSKEDEALAASIRNSADKALFVFSDKYTVTSYFSGTCQRVPFTKALIARSLLN
ncbi:MAG: hypothetical protein ACI9T7_000103 [Oleiphilaceae bacterium]|jgi:hypothetical protein